MTPEKAVLLHTAFLDFKQSMSVLLGPNYDQYRLRVFIEDGVNYLEEKPKIDSQSKYVGNSISTKALVQEGVFGTAYVSLAEAERRLRSVTGFSGLGTGVAAIFSGLPRKQRLAIAYAALSSLTPHEQLEIVSDSD